MNRQSIGKLIQFERNHKGISTQQLASGICSVTTLQRLENGERLPDFFVLERMIERLGKSVNKIELLYNQAAYKLYYLREVLESDLKKKRYKDVLKGLELYEAMGEAKDNLHKQYILKLYAVIASEMENDYDKAVMYLEDALNQTVPGFQLNKLDDFLLGEGELVILLMWLQESSRLGKTVSSFQTQQILQYIERICDDEEIRTNIYSKAVWVLGDLLIGKGEQVEALKYLITGKDILVANGNLIHLPQILDRVLELSKKYKVDYYRELKKQRDALKDLFEEYGEVWETKTIDLWKNYRQLEVYLVSELCFEARKKKGQTQEKLAQEVDIDHKTLSRIENGRYTPKEGTFRKIKEYLEIDRDICSTRIVAEDFSLLEIERQIAKLNHFRQEAKAEELYQKLKVQLSLEWKENQQYVKYMDTLFDFELKRIGAKEAFHRCEEALQITQKNVNIEDLDKVILNRTEFMIVNFMARCYDKLGQKEKTIDLLGTIFKGYKKSKVDLKYHYPSLALLYIHIAGICEDCNRFEDSINWCNQAIQFDFQCKRGLNLGFMLEEKTYALDRMTGDRSKSKSKYLQAYQLLKMMNKKSHMLILQKYYKEWYGEEIDKPIIKN